VQYLSSLNPRGNCNYYPFHQRFVCPMGHSSQVNR
jgi:hypothetical protein